MFVDYINKMKYYEPTQVKRRHLVFERVTYEICMS